MAYNPNANDWPQYVVNREEVDEILVTVTGAIGQLHGILAALDPHEVPFLAQSEAGTVSKLPLRFQSEIDGALASLDEHTYIATPIRAALACLWADSVFPESSESDLAVGVIVAYVFSKDRELPFVMSDLTAVQMFRPTEGQGGVDATRFVRWFLEGLLSQTNTAIDDAMFIVRKNRFFKQYHSALNVRQTVTLESLFARGRAHVALGLSAKIYGEISGASPATVTRDLAKLETIGAVKRSRAGGRSTRYWIEI